MIKKLNNHKWLIKVILISFLFSFITFHGSLLYALSFTFFLSLIFFPGNKVVKKKVRKKYEFLSSETDFSNSLIQLIAVVIRVDNKETDSEIRYVEKSLSNHFKGERIAQMLKSIKYNLKKESIDLIGICRLIRLNFQTASKVQLMHLLIGICAADGLLTKKEDQLLKKIAIEIRLPFITYKQLLNMFRFKFEGEQQKRKSGNSTSKSRIKLAFGVLGLEPTATETEIKKTYRKLAVRHHPDKVAHLGEEMFDTANDKFILISEAYELIKQQKGFN